MEEYNREERILLGLKTSHILSEQLEQVSGDSLTTRMLTTTLLAEKYCTPVICLFGALGNALSLAVFCFDAKYRSQSSSFYPSALAISDTGFLLNVFIVWFEGWYGGGILMTPWTCPLVMYLGQVTCFMSVYFTVAFSVERYVVVHSPFSRRQICTKSKAKKVIALITLTALLIFSYVWLIAGVISDPADGKDGYPTQLPEVTLNKLAYDEDLRHDMAITQGTGENNIMDESGFPNEMKPVNTTHLCSVPPVYFKISQVAIYLDSVLTLIIPFFIIAYLNAQIAKTLWNVGKQPTDIVAVSTSQGISNHTIEIKGNTGACNNLSPRNNPECSSSSSGVRVTTVVIYHERQAGREQNCRNICYVVQTNPTSDLSTGPPTRCIENQTEVIEMETFTAPIPIEAPENRCDFQTSQTIIGPSLRKNASLSSEKRATNILLLVSLAFLLLNLPAHAIRCAQFIQVLTGTHEGRALLQSLQPLANILFNTNYAVNFLLYCMSGRNFRRSLKTVISRVCRLIRGPFRVVKPYPNRFSSVSDRQGRFRTNSTRTSMVAAIASTLTVPAAPVTTVWSGESHPAGEPSAKIGR